MTFPVELSKCRWTTQGIDPTHIFPDPSMEVNEGPILVSLMNDQNYFVHDGRHRCIRALLRGDTMHDAEWLEDHDAELEVARLREALKRDALRQEIDRQAEYEAVSRALKGGYIPPMSSEDVDVNAIRKNLGFPSYNGPIAYPWLNDEQGGEICDAVVMRSGAVAVNPESPVREALLEALNRAIHKAACGRAHLHEPHAFGENMEEFCSGQPRQRKALCGKTYEHESHDAYFSHMSTEQWCDGIPK
jgi:hypothetical protein